MENHLDKATAELEAINKQMAALATRRDELQVFVRVHKGFSGQITTNADPQMRPQIVQVTVCPPIKPATKKQRIIETVASILSDGKPRHTRELLDELSVRGVEVAGAKPVVNLSVYLNRSEYFGADRKTGWSLKKENPEDAPTSSGLFTNGADEAPPNRTG